MVPALSLSYWPQKEILSFVGSVSKINREKQEKQKQHRGGLFVKRGPRGPQPLNWTVTPDVLHFKWKTASSRTNADHETNRVCSDS